MNSYADRLSWAMKCAGLSPHTDQSTLSRMVGGGCSPQVIQYLLNPDKNAKSSKYTPQIAAALGCDVLWLADGTGAAPEPKGDPVIPPGKIHPGKQVGLFEGNQNLQKLRVNDPERNTSGSGNVTSEQLEDFFEEMRAARTAGSINQQRFTIMKGLLHEWNAGFAGSLTNQRLATRGGHVGAKKGRKTGTE